MVIAGWRKNFEVLADAGQRACPNCHHTTRHFLVGERKEVRLYFLPVAKFGRKRSIVCEVCGHTTQVKEQDAGVLMREALQPSTPPATMALPAPPPSALTTVPSPPESDWDRAGRNGIQRTMKLLSDKYAWPWTLEQLDSGLRGELPDTLFRCIVEELSEESGTPDDPTRARLRYMAEEMSRVLRTQVAITSAAARVQAGGIDEPSATEVIVSTVCAEMGVGRDEGLRLVEQAIALSEK